MWTPKIRQFGGLGVYQNQNQTLKNHWFQNQMYLFDEIREIALCAAVAMKKQALARLSSVVVDRIQNRNLVGLSTK